MCELLTFVVADVVEDGNDECWFSLALDSYSARSELSMSLLLLLSSELRDGAGPDASRRRMCVLPTLVVAGVVEDGNDESWFSLAFDSYSARSKLSMSLRLRRSGELRDGAEPDGNCRRICELSTLRVVVVTEGGDVGSWFSLMGRSCSARR